MSNIALPQSETIKPWQVMAAGMAAMLLTVGIARFAYTPMLPLMQAQTGMSPFVGGLLATVNYAGYMTGALMASTISDARKRFLVYRVGLIAGVIGTAGMGLTTQTWAWLLLRYIAGVGGASGMLLASGMVLAFLVRHGRRPELGLHFIGLAVGIILSGALVMATNGSLDWAGQWHVFGAVTLALLIPAWFWMPAPDGATTTRAAGAAKVPHPGAWLLNLSYFCAGVGFVVSATFVVAAAAKVPQLSHLGPFIWIVVGVAAIPATLAWDRLARRIGDVPTLILAYALQIVGIILPLVSHSALAAIGGALLFGGTFMGIVALTLALAGKRNSDNPSGAMARLTLSYGVAQIVAPAVVGRIADMTGSYDIGMIMAAITMVIGIVLLWAYGKASGA
ncbi:YbfB/YjiJ family MFS transporter [Rhizobium sp. C4]|uniref:YbfB/YjiJ family MFS transporter n=1 Tax=Rhizobium sp. C4 TaxID=1349800 RepID=UPI001E54BCB1|nr:YbfB/YjiJ family MFS transporter [Rhizobium sp. C4]MCD2172940.1 YbfB/YjiJ family MFS transporter [Rhizobium sp. C4]